jgi:hypothetical protein
MAKIKKDLEQEIRRQAKDRCGYCLNPQELMPYKLEFEHILPKALGGTSDDINNHPVGENYEHNEQLTTRTFATLR